ncbi:hypothetical protein LRP50_06545 [Enterovibrio sp. ZSDZ42]|uniref:Lipoprotein n=1 Tax=Enterovibrio gelatinilyticus TaxID=2899819 RepID=A0ABT5QYF0_9GAMM|nr:hypothetical protein [Enterovibrio sp. ZSDZ42]MDD1792779.1 hypothetical protein [Enterovibrio sp. ZSDZ42]
MRDVKRLFLPMTICLLATTACTDEMNPQGPIARFANSGSLDGPYSMVDIKVRDSSGGHSGFGFGAVSSYPGASADIGGIGVPAYIEGYWAKKNIESKGYQEYFYISKSIDSKLALRKASALKHYYKTLQTNLPIMQFVVDGPRARLFLSSGCYYTLEPKKCEPRENADPNGWVVKDPIDGTDIVVLFDGLAESSPTAFPMSPLDTRYLNFNTFYEGRVDSVEVTDHDGKIAERSAIMPKTLKAHWRELINPEANWDEWTFRYYRFHTETRASDSLEKSIQAYRNAFDGYLKQSYFKTVAKGDDVVMAYTVSCLREKTLTFDCPIAEDPKQRWEYIQEIEEYGVVLFRGKAEVSDTPFQNTQAQ